MFLQHPADFALHRFFVVGGGALYVFAVTRFSNCVHTQRADLSEQALPAAVAEAREVEHDIWTQHTLRCWSPASLETRAGNAGTL
jgi:hypothetical protein